jgi:hypothetical protein
MKAKLLLALFVALNLVTFVTALYATSGRVDTAAYWAMVTDLNVVATGLVLTAVGTLLHRHRETKACREALCEFCQGRQLYEFSFHPTGDGPVVQRPVACYLCGGNPSRTRRQKKLAVVRAS